MTLDSFGFPIASGATIWKHNRPVSAATILDAVEVALRERGALPERRDGRIAASLPALYIRSWNPARWFAPELFHGVRRVTVELEETERRFRLVARARTSLLLPLAAAFVSYGISRELLSGAPLLSPLIGLSAGAFYWFVAWARFAYDMYMLGLRCDRAIPRLAPN